MDFGRNGVHDIITGRNEVLAMAKVIFFTPVCHSFCSRRGT